MIKTFSEEICPQCHNNTLYVEHSDFHHLEECESEDCDYKYSEYLDGYEEFLFQNYDK